MKAAVDPTVNLNMMRVNNRTRECWFARDLAMNRLINEDRLYASAGLRFMQEKSEKRWIMVWERLNTAIWRTAFGDTPPMDISPFGHSGVVKSHASAHFMLLSP
jgi:hypothetical protein